MFVMVAALQIARRWHGSLAVDAVLVVFCVYLEVSRLRRARTLQYPCSLLLVFTKVLPTTDGVAVGPELLTSYSSSTSLALSLSAAYIFLAAVIVVLSWLHLLVIGKSSIAVEIGSKCVLASASLLMIVFSFLYLLLGLTWRSSGLQLIF